MITRAKKLTYDDYCRIPPDGLRHEIIEGEEFVTPAPNLRHQDVLLKLARLLAEHVDKHGLGRVLIAPVDVVLSQDTVVQPDLVFVSKAKASILTEDNIQGAPDLLIEVLSPSTESIDRGKKLARYEEAGVSEYWIVNPAAGMVEVHEFGSPRRTRVLQEGQVLQSAILPGLALKLSDVFAR